VEPQPEHIKEATNEKIMLIQLLQDPLISTPMIQKILILPHQLVIFMAALPTMPMLTGKQIWKEG